MDNAADREVWDMADQGKKKKTSSKIEINISQQQIQGAKIVNTSTMYYRKRIPLKNVEVCYTTCHLLVSLHEIQ